MPGILVLLTLIPVLLLAYRAWQASGVHRATAESVVEDYAAIAASRFGLVLEGQLNFRMLRPVNQAFQKARMGRAGFYLPRRSYLLHDDTPKELPPYEIVRSFFLFDSKTRELQLSEMSYTEDERAWLDQRLLDIDQDATTTGDAWFLRLDGDGPKPRAMGYLLAEESPHNPRTIIGFDLNWHALHGLFDLVAREGDLLPEPLTRHLDEQNPVSIMLRSANGTTLYRSARLEGNELTVEETLGKGSGELMVTAAIRPDVADQLVVGGLPPSRITEITAALGAMVVLVGAIFFLLRRERELARLRSGFVASVSHELRTPLAQIRLFAETLLLGRIRSASERRRALVVIDQEARRLGHQVENVLQFSRAERTAVSLRLEVQALGAIVSDVVEGFEPLARARKVSLSTKIENVPEVAIDGDAMRRVLLNLLDNAVKYGPAGQTVEVIVKAVPTGIRVVVADQGPGIATRDRGRIWDKYWRAPAASESSVAGTGIGLFLVRELIDGHGGHVRIAGRRGAGACFVIDLPFSEATTKRRTGDARIITRLETERAT